MTEVAVLIQGEDQASKIFRKVERAGQKSADAIAKSWKQAGDKIKQTGEAITRAGSTLTKISAPVALIGGAAVKMAADFERSLTNVSTLIKGDSEPAIQKLRIGVMALLKEVPKSAEDLGSSLYAILSGGIKETGAALATLEASAKLAVAGLGETAEATNLMVVATKAFGLDAKDAEKNADILFKTVKNGITTVSALATNFGQAAGQASSIGVTFEDLQASTAALTTVTGKTAQSQTQLAALFREVGDDGGAFDKQLRKLGFSTEKLREAIGDKGLGRGLEFARDKMKLTNEEFKLLIGSSEAQFAAFSLLTSANEAYTEALDDMLRGSNALNEAFEKQKNTAHAMWQIMKNRVNVALIQLGDKILPKILPVVNKFGQFVEKLANKFETLFPGMQDAILIAGAFISILGPAVLIVGALVGSLGGIVAAVGSVAAALGVSAGAIIVPILALVSAVGVLTAAWAKNWGNIRGKTEAALQHITALLSPIVADIKAAFDVIKKDVLAAWEEISTSPQIQKLIEVFNQVFPILVAIVDAALPVIWGMFKFFASAWYKITKSQLRLIWEVFKWLVDNVLPIVVSLVQGIAEWFQVYMPIIVQTVQATVQAIVQWWTQGTSQASAIVATVQRWVAIFKQVMSQILAVVAPPLIELVAWFSSEFNEIATLINEILTGIAILIGDFLGGLISIASPYLQAYVDLHVETWNTLKELTVSAFEAISSAIENALSAIAGFFGPLLQPLIAMTALVFGKVKQTVVDKINEVKAWLQSINWSSVGRKFMQTLALGIRAAASLPLTAVKSILRKIRALLPGSDAKEGPLSDITEAGKGMMTTFAAGVKKGTPDIEAQVVASMSRVNVAAEKALDSIGKGLSKKELARQRKRAEALVRQREFDNLDRIAQMEQRGAEEIALAKRHGQDVAAIEEFWRAKIAGERQRQAEKQVADTRSKNDALIQLEQEAIQKERDLQGQRAQFFGDLSSAFAGFNEAAGGNIQALFVLSKAAAIAEAIINTHLAATVALASAPPPVNFALAAAVTAKGLASVAIIAAQAIAMAQGGIVTSPTLALIGEAGPEAVVPLNQFGRGGDNYELNIVFNGPFLGTTQEANKFSRMIFDSHKRLTEKRA